MLTNHAYGNNHNIYEHNSVCHLINNYNFHTVVDIVHDNMKYRNCCDILDVNVNSVIVNVHTIIACNNHDNNYLNWTTYSLSSMVHLFWFNSSHKLLPIFDTNSFTKAIITWSLLPWKFKSMSSTSFLTIKSLSTQSSIRIRISLSNNT